MWIIRVLQTIMHCFIDAKNAIYNQQASSKSNKTPFCFFNAKRQSKPRLIIMIWWYFTLFIHYGHDLKLRYKPHLILSLSLGPLWLCLFLSLCLSRTHTNVFRCFVVGLSVSCNAHQDAPSHGLLKYGAERSIFSTPESLADNYIGKLLLKPFSKPIQNHWNDPTGRLWLTISVLWILAAFTKLYSKPCTVEKIAWIYGKS